MKQQDILSSEKQQTDPNGHKLYNFKEPGYLSLRHYLFTSGLSSRLGPFNLTVYLCVLHHVDWSKGIAKIKGGIRTISQETGIDRRTIIKCLYTLKQFRLLFFRENQRGKRIYWPLHQSEWKNITMYTWKAKRKDTGMRNQKHRKYKETQEPGTLYVPESKHCFLVRGMYQIKYLPCTRPGTLYVPAWKPENDMKSSKPGENSTPPKISLLNSLLYKESLDMVERSSYLDHAPEDTKNSLSLAEKHEKKSFTCFQRKILKPVPEHPDAKKLSDVQERVRQQELLQKEIV